MSYTNVPSNIIENEIEMLTNINYSNNQYQLLSNISLNRGIDYDDESSISRSVRSASNNNVSNSRTNEVNSESKNNTIEPSGTTIEKVNVVESEDVVFGTVYQGPVAIQTLILGRNDLKQKFNIQYSDNSDPLKTRTEKASKAYYRKKLYNFRSFRRFFVFTLGIVVLVTTIFAAGYYLYFLEKLLQVDPTATTADNVELVNYQTTPITKDGDYQFIERKKYGAVSPKEVREPLALPVKRVIISHTATPICKDYSQCAARVVQIQNFHMTVMGYDDIAYNFLVGGDGRAYEGCGYVVGAHTKDNNKGSVCIAFIGNFTSVEAQEKQIKAALRVIDDGIKMNKIHPDYVLYGHRQLQSTESPGTMLYNQIMSWPHWSKEIIPL